MSRYRSRGVYTTRTCALANRYYTCPKNDSWANVGTQPLYSAGRIETMFDVLISDYHKRSAKGEVFFNPMRKTIDETTAITGASDEAITRKRTPQNCGGGVLIYGEDRVIGPQFEVLHMIARTPAGTPFVFQSKVPVDPLITDSEISSMVSEAATRCSSERGRFDSNLWETLAEINKTLGIGTQILTNSLKVLKGIPNVSRAGRRSFDAPEGLANLYLLKRYGIDPLVSDLSNVLKNVNQVARRLRKTTRAKVNLKRNTSVTRSYSGSIVRVEMYELMRHEVSVRAMSLDDVEASYENFLGLTTKGLLTLPWELTKYSFVADWFFNIGDFIGAVAPSPGWTQLGSCYVIEDVRSNHVLAGPNFGTATDDVVAPRTGAIVRTLTTKSRISGLPAPSVVVKTDFRFDNLTRFLDASALVTQVLARRMK